MRFSDEDRRKLERLRTDLIYFCRTCLQIKLKEGGSGPFILNRAQQYLHERMEDQLARTGMVRMFILKGRQQGISTYIAARYYHKACWNIGKRVFILSHHSKTTGVLFQIVDKYYHVTPAALRPILLTDNDRQMVFDNDSQYTVATAGSGSVGRGDTTQFLHWSEVAFSENITELLTGVVQTVADVAGTEIANESTANGIGDFFHRGCLAAMSGEVLETEDAAEKESISDLPYELVFIPWHWNDEYRATPKPGFKCDEYEHMLKEMYNLDDEQIQWRRNKIAFFKLQGFGDKKFKQEYPFTVAEAFQASGDSLIDGERVDMARKSRIVDMHGPLIISCDPARNGDRTVIVWRRGRHVQKIQIHTEMNEMLLAGKLSNIWDRDKPDAMFVDVTGGTGNGAVDRLHERNYKKVQGIKFSSKPNDDRYSNKRAEMAGLLKEWFEDEGGCRIPDDEETGVELAMIPAFKETSKGLLQLESKDNIKKIYGKSPDIFDAIMLGFAQPVRPVSAGDGYQRNVRSNHVSLDANRHRVGKKPLPSDDPPQGWIRRR